MTNINQECYFQAKTFSLLAELHHHPHQEFYKQKKEEFKQYVENPFKTLFNYIASQLPLEMTRLMETENKLFSPLLTNEYHQQQSNDFMWGAFYPKNGNRTEDAQLFLFLNYETLEFGFYIGKLGLKQQDNFIDFCQNNREYILNLIDRIYYISNDIYLGSRDNYCLKEEEVVSSKIIKPEDWLRALNRENIHLAVILPASKVLEYSQKELSSYIINLYKNLFPLVLITLSHEPIPKIEEYRKSLSNTQELPLQVKFNNLTGGEEKKVYRQKFWWFNQINDYDFRQEPYLIIPRRDQKTDLRDFYWETIRTSTINDLIFHYQNGLIFAVSKLRGIPEIIDKKKIKLSSAQYFNNQEVFYALKINFILLEKPLKINDLPLTICQQESLASPFDRLGKIGVISREQIYPISDILGNFLLEKIKNQIPNFINQKSETPSIKNQEYSLDDLSKDTYFSLAQLEKMIKVIKRKKQVILQGAPGTGKTFLAQHLAKYLISNSDGFTELVQFHPSYSYEDFIQGLRPITNQNGQLEYKMIKGRFLEFCEKAQSCQGQSVLIIDEINRGNLASIFGELMYLLEYRDHQIKLAGSQAVFSIPENVYIIGTMNTADRSIALVDHALRRRFAFLTIKSHYDVLRKYHQGKKELNIEELIKVLKYVNKTINDPHYELGLSFFLTEELTENIEDIWQLEIEPYLEEYFFDSLDRIKEFRWDQIKNKIM